MSARGYLGVAIPLRTANAGVVVALPVLAVQEVHDLALGGALVAVALVPSVLTAPLVGVWLDRAAHPRRLVLIGGVVTALTFAIAAMLGAIPTPVVVGALIVSGCATQLFMGGLSSFVGGEVAPDQRAYAVDALAYNVTSVIGPTLVAITLAVSSARTAVWLLACCALLGSILSGGVRMPRRESPRSSIAATMIAGVRQLVFHRPLAVVTASGTLTQLGAGALPIAAVLLGIARAGGAGTAAVLMTAFAVGGVAGALIVTVSPARIRRPEWVMMFGFAAIGVSTFAAIPDWGIVWTLATFVVAGVFTGPSTAAMLLLRAQQSPAAVRSQVFAVSAGLRVTVGGIGAAVAGALAGLDAGPLLLAIGGVWVASAAVMLAYPRGVVPIEGGGIAA